MSPQSRKPVRPLSSKRFPRCGSPWTTVAGPARQSACEHVLVVDVELGDRGEVGAQPVAMVVEPVLEQRRRRSCSSGWSPAPIRRAPSRRGGILELEVQVGEILERPRGGVGRDTVPAVGNRAAGGVEIFEQLHERPVTVVVPGRVHRGHAHGEHRRELGVEARLLRAHVAGGERLPPRRIERRQLANIRSGTPAGSS